MAASAACAPAYRCFRARLPSRFPLHFKDYPRGVEYFDVHSPTISSLYSQVFWTGLPPVDLPADIVARYAGRGMAVVGFEVDQVRPGAGPNGEDVPLPINVAYNHHFESGMSGAKSRFEKIAFDGPDDPRIAELEKGMAHGIPNHKEHWVLRETEAAPGGIPSSQSFSGGNGGEYRKSFHGYPPSYAQVIYSPERFQFTPMQIDTWHREKMNLTGSPFVQGPVPRNAWSPKTGSPDSLCKDVDTHLLFQPALSIPFLFLFSLTPTPTPTASGAFAIAPSHPRLSESWRGAWAHSFAQLLSHTPVRRFGPAGVPGDHQAPQGDQRQLRHRVRGAVRRRRRRGVVRRVL